jgi:signal transduction histidine kinase
MEEYGALNVTGAMVIKSLLTLSKIENNQYTQIEKLDLVEFIEKYLEIYQYELNDKELLISLSKKEVFPIQMNKSLAEILIGNLMQNAIRHNTNNGTINISCSPDLLEGGALLQISNTGFPLTSKPISMFERFVKNSENAQSTGLGLSIVSRICEKYDIKITYQMDQNIHTISLRYLPE